MNIHDATEQAYKNGYEKGYEQGKKDALLDPCVIVLPCKIGDEVWGIRSYHGVKHPQQGRVDGMYFTSDMRLNIRVKHICIGNWGEKIFATREEAEAALKEDE
jgi:flagellar biosynthesis/type III secretory pathway protein FliH